MKKVVKKRLMKHLTEDAHEDRELMKSIKDAAKHKEKKKDPKKKKHVPKTKYAKDKVEKVMHEFKEGDLQSGSQKGPKVKNRKQAVAIALSEARRGKKK